MIEAYITTTAELIDFVKVLRVTKKLDEKNFGKPAGISARRVELVEEGNCTTEHIMRLLAAHGAVLHIEAATPADTENG